MSTLGGEVQSWFWNEERLRRLQAVAASWVGTPFCPNAAVKGAGVSCQKLVGRIYAEANFMDGEFVPPDGPMDWGRAHTEDESLIVKYMDGQVAAGRFADVPQREAKVGDLVGFRIGGCVQHLGIVITGRSFVHCLRGMGVAMNRIDDATWARRVSRIWRPIG